MIPRKTARINGRRWRIDVVATLPDDAYGICDDGDRRIALREGPTHQLQDTLFHELVHAACPSLTEKQVLEVERGVFAVLSENPELREWMFQQEAE